MNIKYPKPSKWLALFNPIKYNRRLALHEGRTYVTIDHNACIVVDRESLLNSTAYKRQLMAAKQLTQQLTQQETYKQRNIELDKLKETILDSIRKYETLVYPVISKHLNLEAYEIAEINRYLTVCSGRDIQILIFDADAVAK